MTVATDFGTASDWYSTVIALAVLTCVAGVGLWAFGIRRPYTSASAIARAIVQLGVLSLILSGVISDPLWVGLALLTMFVAAVWTSSRRIGGEGIAGKVALAMAAGNVVALSVVFATGAIEFSARYILAIGGIVIGNTMSISTLAGRAFAASVTDHWDEVEGWLALGARPVDATRRLARASVFSAIVPTIDQTRTTGLVVLPGAFVGAIFGGASPLEAGRFQVLVLAAILAAGTVTAITLLLLSGAVTQRPAPQTGLAVTRRRQSSGK